MFIKKQAFTCLFEIPLWYEIDNVTIYFLIVLVKISIENNISIPIHPGIMYLWNMAVSWGCISMRGRDKGGKEALMSNLCLISHRWYDMEKLTVSGSNNLNLSFSGAHQKIFILKRWKKNVLHFILLNQLQRFLQNYRGKGDFSVQKLGVFFQS